METLKKIIYMFLDLLYILAYLICLPVFFGLVVFLVMVDEWNDIRDYWEAKYK